MQQHNMHVHNIYLIAIRPLETEEDDSSEEDEGGEDDLAEDGDALSSEEEYEMDSDS